MPFFYDSLEPDGNGGGLLQDDWNKRRLKKFDMLKEYPATSISSIIAAAQHSPPPSPPPPAAAAKPATLATLAAPEAAAAVAVAAVAAAAAAAAPSSAAASAAVAASAAAVPAHGRVPGMASLRIGALSGRADSTSTNTARAVAQAKIGRHNLTYLAGSAVIFAVLGLVPMIAGRFRGDRGRRAERPAEA